MVQSWKAKLKEERRLESQSRGKSGVSTVQAREMSGWEERWARRDWVAGLRRVGERGESSEEKRRVIFGLPEGGVGEEEEEEEDKREKRFWIMASGLPEGRRKVGPPTARAMVVRISRMVRVRWWPFIMMILLFCSSEDEEEKEEERYSANWCSSRRLEP